MGQVGASCRAEVSQLLLREILLVLAAGLGLGGMATFGAGQWVRTMLFGITPHDPPCCSWRRLCRPGLRWQRVVSIGARLAPGVIYFSNTIPADGNIGNIVSSVMDA